MQVFQGVKHVNCIAIQSCASNATVTSNTIDTLGYNELQICVMRETHATAGFSALTIQEADSDAATSFATTSGLVAGTDYTVADAIGGTSAAVTNVSFVANIDLRGKKRYFRVIVTPATATGYVASHAILGKGEVSAPDSAAGVAELVNTPD
jgi:hypothetical protein